jgi:hypothetical protein
MKAFLKFLIFLTGGILSAILIFGYIIVSNEDAGSVPGGGAVLVLYLAILLSIPSFFLGGFLFLHLIEKIKK